MEMIQSYRVKADRAEKLKDKSFDLSMESREHIREPDLIGFLIDTCAKSIMIKNGNLSLDIEEIKRTLLAEHGA